MTQVDKWMLGACLVIFLVTMWGVRRDRREKRKSDSFFSGISDSGSDWHGNDSHGGGSSDGGLND